MWCSDEIISFWHPDKHTNTQWQNLYFLATRPVDIHTSGTCAVRISWRNCVSRWQSFVGLRIASMPTNVLTDMLRLWLDSSRRRSDVRSTVFNLNSTRYFVITNRNNSDLTNTKTNWWKIVIHYISLCFIKDNWLRENSVSVSFLVITFTKRHFSGTSEFFVCF